MHRFGRVAVAAVMCGSAALGVGTVAQASPGKGPGHQKAFNGNAHLIHVGLNPEPVGPSRAPRAARSTCTATRRVTAQGSTFRARCYAEHELRPRHPLCGPDRDAQDHGAGNGTAHIKISAPLPTGLTIYVDISVLGGGGGSGGYGDTFIAGPFNLGAKK